MAQFPEPASLNVLEIGDGMDHSAGKYNLSNPHPGFGKDPNILNQFGHTNYPKFVYPDGKSNPGVIVKNEAEETEVMNTEVKPLAPAKADNGWSE